MVIDAVLHHLEAHQDVLALADDDRKAHIVVGWTCSCYGSWIWDVHIILLWGVLADVPCIERHIASVIDANFRMLQLV